MAELSDWAKRLLEGRNYATLATQDADGSPHLTPGSKVNSETEGS